MQTVIVGAGIVGVTTAYYLSQLGCQVTVVERLDTIAGETSFANGGQLSYGFAEALASPDFVRKIPGLIAGRNFAARIHLTPALIPWGFRFLMECRSSRARASTVALLNLAQTSARLMNELVESTAVDFSFRHAGKLVLLSNDEEVSAARSGTRMKRARGLDIEVLSRKEAESVEPAIARFRGPVKAATYARNDDVGDACHFANGLKEYLVQERGVTFLLGTSAQSVQVDRGRATGIHCAGKHNGIINGDSFVVCLGAWSDTLLRPLGIRNRIFPVRGYSVTLPVGHCAPSASLTTLTNRFVFSRLDTRMRIAGFTDFDDFRTARDEKRIETLISAARRLAPDYADYDAREQHRWGGFRPMTASGLPIAGSTELPGLYLNIGHGMLGWTLACATAKLVADEIVRHAA